MWIQPLSDQTETSWQKSAGHKARPNMHANEVSGIPVAGAKNEFVGSVVFLQFLHEY